MDIVLFLVLGLMFTLNLDVSPVQLFISLLMDSLHFQMARKQKEILNISTHSEGAGSVYVPHGDLARHSNVFIYIYI